VHPHHRVPLLFARRHQHAVAHEAGVVDDDVEPPPGRHRRVDEALTALPVGDVVAVGDGLAAAAADGVGDLLGDGAGRAAPVAGDAEIVDHHARPQARQLLGVRAPEAAPGAGDDTHAPVEQPRHHSRSMMVTLAWPPPSHIVCRP
jgi:hypothetical protein